MSAKLVAIAFTAAALMLTPAAASASDTKAARAAIAAAKAKLDMNERQGLTGAAADAQGRARLALDRAMKKMRDGRESAALAEAQQADSLADLAAASKDRSDAVIEARAQEAALAR